MAKCDYHRYGGNRGRVPSWCGDCQIANNAAKAAKVAKALERAAVKPTRDAGRQAVFDLYEKQRAEIRNKFVEEVKDIDARYNIEFAAPEILACQAAIEEMTRKLELLQGPITIARMREHDAARKEFERARSEALALSNTRYENLKMRCHVWVGKSKGSACGKYLDYNGHCPRHGDIGAPGS